MTPRDHHPIADLFPMLAEDELRELAADIKQRGQLQPIMLDDQGRILDGRNRNAACDLAGVEPWFEDYKGEDPDGYALAVNIHRRNLSKGQIAMVAAQALLKNSSQSKVATSVNVSQQYIGHARVVLDFAPELAAAVAAGALPHNEAYKVANEKKASADAEAKALAEAKAEHAAFGCVADAVDLVEGGAGVASAGGSDLAGLARGGLLIRQLGG